MIFIIKNPMDYLITGEINPWVKMDHLNSNLGMLFPDRTTSFSIAHGYVAVKNGYVTLNISNNNATTGWGIITVSNGFGAHCVAFAGRGSMCYVPVKKGGKLTYETENCAPIDFRFYPCF